MSIRFSEHLEGSGSDIMTQACRMRLEGVIAKRPRVSTDPAATPTG